MNLVTIKGETYNLDLLVKYITHVGTREVGTTEEIVDPRAIFGEYRYVELVFADGSRVELDAVQSSALLQRLAAGGPALDLDRLDESALGHVVVHDTEGGDIILPDEPDEGAVIEPDLSQEDDDATGR